MRNILLSILFILIGMQWATAQGFAFGVKGGLVLGTQKWNNLDQGVLFGRHVSSYIESLTPENNFALFAQLGYHERGSARRNQQFFDLGGNISRFNQEFIFQNLSLTIGAKQKKDAGINGKIYYMLGLRGEYTLDTNLDDYADFCPGFFPFEELVRDWNFGLTIGGGYEHMFSELIGAFIEFSVLPDISFQYRQPAFNFNSANGCNIQTNVTSVGEREIRNLSFEVTVGVRFLNKIEYVD